MARRYRRPIGETPSKNAVPTRGGSSKQALAGTGYTTPRSGSVAEHEGRVPQPSIPAGPRNSGQRYTPPPPPILSTLSDLLTPGPTEHDRKTAEAAHRLGVKPESQSVPSSIGAAAGSLLHTVSQGVSNLSQDAAELPKQRVHSFLGRRTLGTPTIHQLVNASLHGKTRVNKRGRLTIPATRQAARQLVKARRAVNRSRGGNSVEAQVGRALLKHGLNRTGAAGILGNAYAESSLQPGATGYGGGGLWGFTAHPNSLSDLQAFAAAQGKSWEDPTVQTNFLLRHVSPETIQQVNSAGTPQRAAAAFMEGFEHPGIPRQGVREAAAQKAFSGQWAKPNPQAMAQLVAAKQNARKQGIPVKAGDTERGPQPNTVFVRADAKGMVNWAKALLGTQEGSRLQLKWAAQSGVSAAEPWCSEFIAAGMARRGLPAPENPAYSGTWLTWKGGSVIGTDLRQAKPGDILVFGPRSSTAHVGLYIGNGQMISGNYGNEVAQAPVAQETASEPIAGIVRPHYRGGKVAVKESAVLPGAGIGPSGELVSGPAGVGAGGAGEAAGAPGQAQGSVGIGASTALGPLNPLLSPHTEGLELSEPGAEDIVKAILRRKR